MDRVSPGDAPVLLAVAAWLAEFVALASQRLSPPDRRETLRFSGSKRDFPSQIIDSKNVSGVAWNLLSRVRRGCRDGGFDQHSCKFPQGIAMQRFKLFLLAGLLACGLLPAMAGATPVQFNIEGQFNRPTSGTFAGTIDIDTALGTVVDANILFSGLAPFDIVRVSVSQQNKSWRVRVDNASRDIFQFFFTTPLASGNFGSLIGFDGGLISQGNVAGPSISGTITGFSGSLTPTRAVPEPAALDMFGAGVLLLGLFVTLRRRLG
jgi:hypothetical protein